MINSQCITVWALRENPQSHTKNWMASVVEEKACECCEYVTKSYLCLQLCYRLWWKGPGSDQMKLVTLLLAQFWPLALAEPWNAAWLLSTQDFQVRLSSHLSILT
jgi:hypothetical protein